MNQLPRNISSLEVAEMVGREHNDVLKDLRRIKSQLGEGTSSQSYFIESTYTNSQNKELPCFLLTKKGCELYGTRMTGEKGTQFAVKYIDRFNEMEQHIQQPKPLSEIEQLKAAMRLSLATSEEIETLKEDVVVVKSDIEHLKDNIYINSSQAKAIRRKVGEKVYDALGGNKSNAFKHLKSKTFAACWREFRNYFDISEYRELPRIKFEDAMRFLFAWQPNTELRLEIEHYNTQLQLKLVK
ncbi:antirepressor [Lysinibacillus sp. PLM2]|nr:antirepressor [Lysinibacillus sp. PLM2]